MQNQATSTQDLNPVSLYAETASQNIHIGNFRTKEQALRVAKEDAYGDNPVCCVYGEVAYIWDDEIIFEHKTYFAPVEHDVFA